MAASGDNEVVWKMHDATYLDGMEVSAEHSDLPKQYFGQLAKMYHVSDTEFALVFADGFRKVYPKAGRVITRERSGSLPADAEDMEDDADMDDLLSMMEGISLEKKQKLQQIAQEMKTRPQTGSQEDAEVEALAEDIMNFSLSGQGADRVSQRAHMLSVVNDPKLQQLINAATQITGGSSAAGAADNFRNFRN